MYSFDIYFLGEMLPGADPAAVRNGVAQLFKMQGSAVDRLFSGKPLRVKKGVDADTASRYRAAFREAGALIQIVPTGSPTPAAKTPSAAATAPASLMTGSEAAPADPMPPEEPSDAIDEAPSDLEQTLTLIVVDETPAEDAVAPPDGRDMTLAEPGVILDLTPPAPQAEYDTSRLEALPPNTGTLEDCREDKPPRPIPDISHLKLVD